MEVRELLAQTLAWMLKEEERRRKDPDPYTLVSISFAVEAAARISKTDEVVVREALHRFRLMTLGLGTSTHEIFTFKEAKALVELAQKTL